MYFYPIEYGIKFISMSLLARCMVYHECTQPDRDGSLEKAKSGLAYLHASGRGRGREFKDLISNGRIHIYAE